MTWRIALSVRVAHDYWGGAAAPVRLEPADPRALAREGLMLRPGPGGGAVIGEDGEDTAPPVELDLLAEDPVLLSVTALAGQGGQPAATVPLFDLTGETADDVTLDLAARAPDAALPRGTGDRRLARLRVALPADGTRTVTVACRAVEALWTYHITGAGAAERIRIHDPEARIAFEDLGPETLPGGRAARVLRSTAPLPLRARPEVRLALEALRPAPFDPATLIPVLPAAGPALRPVREPGAAAPLQSDIYVSLW